MIIEVIKCDLVSEKANYSVYEVYTLSGDKFTAFQDFSLGKHDVQLLRNSDIIHKKLKYERRVDI